MIVFGLPVPKSSGRSRARVEAVAARDPGVFAEVVDVSDPQQVTALAATVGQRWPQLDMVISNAGVQSLFDSASTAPIDLIDVARQIDTNLKGTIYVANAFLPLLKKRPSAKLVNAGFGLGYVPLAAAPVYSATKAAVHSFTQSLRHQLAGSAVRIVEIIAPVVEPDLHRGQSRQLLRAIKLDAFVIAVMAGLNRDDDEIFVGLAKLLRVGSSVAPGFFFEAVNQTR